MKLFSKPSLVFLLGFFVLNATNLTYAQQTKEKPNLFSLTQYQATAKVKGWVMSEKLDGIRAYWNGRDLRTKQGHRIFAPQWFIADLPPFELDGELWLARGKFAETQAIVMDKKPSQEWKRLTYQIFEVPNQQGGLMERLKVLDEFLIENPSQIVHIIPQITITDHQQIRSQLQLITQQGGEGVVIRNPNLAYVTGRQSQMQKVKVKQDAECKVVGYIEGKGKYLNQLGALRCEILPEERTRLFASLPAGKTIIRIGSGLSDAQRKTPPKLGEVVTFQYMGLTKNGLPRFPVFLRIRK